MLSVSRRNFLSLSAATAITTALATQQNAYASTSTTLLNGEGLPSGILRYAPLPNVNYTAPFAQSFVGTPAFVETATRLSDALVEATFATSRPVGGAVYTRVLARRSRNRRDYYTAMLAVMPTGQFLLQIERVMDYKTTVVAQKKLGLVVPEGEFTFDLALSVRADHLKAQVLINQRSLESLEAYDNSVPVTATPQGVGTCVSSYVGRNATPDHRVELLRATSDNWGQHRGSLEAPGWGGLIFEDDFVSGSIDATKWRVRDKDYVGYDSGVILKEAVTTADSSAKIWLKKMATPVTYRDGKLREWATGYLDTIGKFSAEYFRLEYRAKQPASTPEHIGAWGGIWMRPDNTALQGEIDISESYGYTSGKRPLDISNRSEGTVHYGQQSANKSKQGALAPILGQSLADEYHIWAVEKTPAGIKFFFDGIEYLFVSSEDDRYRAALPAGEKFNIRLCMQAGNAYWGGLADSTRDCAIEVDYVRVWEYVG